MVTLQEVKTLIMKKLLILSFVISTLVACERKYIEPFPKSPTVTKVSFSQDLQPLFNADCISCHSNGGYAPDLTTGASYNELLIGAPVNCNSYSSYINTLAPATSLLYIKLLPSPACDDMMPTGGSQWSPAKVQMVLDWIEQGTLNN